MMTATKPEHFRHTTATSYPVKIVGVTLLDETPDFTGIYLRNEEGGLWPCRTVRRDDPGLHLSVCDSWLARPGVNEDRRTA